MRDSTIIAMQQRNARRNGLILAQFEFLKTRQEAMETAELMTPWWHVRRVVWAFSPARKWAFVDAIQKKLLEEAQARMQRAKIVRPEMVVPR